MPLKSVKNIVQWKLDFSSILPYNVLHLAFTSMYATPYLKNRIRSKVLFHHVNLFIYSDAGACVITRSSFFSNLRETFILYFFLEKFVTKWFLHVICIKDLINYIMIPKGFRYITYIYNRLNNRQQSLLRGDGSLKTMGNITIN